VGLHGVDEDHDDHHGVSDLAGAVEREAVAGTTTLGELGVLIDAASWLTDGDVLRVDAIGGKIPISWTPEGTVARIALPGGEAFVYLSVDEDLSEPQLADALCGGPGAEAVIRQLAVQRSG
jgi:hypothetical protein